MPKKGHSKGTTWQAFADMVDDKDSWAVIDDMPTGGPAISLPTAPGSMSAPGEHHHKPLPTQPPYTAHVANLSFDLSQDALGQFFYEKGNCQVIEPRLVFDHAMNRPKGYGYVTFADLESLKSALKLHGQLVIDRAIRVDVAEARQDDRKSRYNNNSSQDSRAGGASTWRNEAGPGSSQFEPMNDNRAGGASTWRSEAGPNESSTNDNRAGGATAWRSENTTTHPGKSSGSPAPSSNSGRQGGPPNSSPFDSFDRSAPRREFVPLTPSPTGSSPSSVNQRKKLDLAPRRTATPDIAGTEKPDVSSSKPNPFGAAKPVDTHAKLREVELMLGKQRLDEDESATKTSSVSTPKEHSPSTAHCQKPFNRPPSTGRHPSRGSSSSSLPVRQPNSPSDSADVGATKPDEFPVRKTQYGWGKSRSESQHDDGHGEFKPVVRTSNFKQRKSPREGRSPGPKKNHDRYSPRDQRQDVNGSPTTPPSKPTEAEPGV